MKLEKDYVAECYVLTKDNESFVFATGQYVGRVSMGLTTQCIALTEINKMALVSMKDEFPDYKLKTMELKFTLESVED